MVKEGIWLSITEYSNYRGISISTVRRYIKADRVQHKFEDGKHWIFVHEENQKRSEEKKIASELTTQLKIKELELKIKTLEEENLDLRMLVNLYENIKPPPIEAARVQN